MRTRILALRVIFSVIVLALCSLALPVTSAQESNSSRALPESALAELFMEPVRFSSTCSGTCDGICTCEKGLCVQECRANFAQGTPEFGECVGQCWLELCYCHQACDPSRWGSCP